MNVDCENIEWCIFNSYHYTFSQYAREELNFLLRLVELLIEDAYKNEILDTGMLEVELESLDISAEEFKEDWMNGYIEAWKEQINAK